MISKAISLLLLSSGLIFAQSDRGTITGTVTDSSGAIVPNAHVTAVNVDTKVPIETTTTDSGDYTIPSIPAAVYTVTIEHTGFKKAAQTGVQVAVAQTVRVNARLDVGATSDSVIVTAEVAELKTETAEQSQNIQGDRFNDLPLNFGGGGVGGSGAIRNPLAFVNLEPGVGAGGGFAGAAINGLPGNTYQVRYAGQDATPSNSTGLTLQTQGSPEIMQEYTIQTSNFAAEYGGATSSIVNLAPKSGTNHFHGSFYDYWANDVMDARNNYVTTAKPKERKNDFGASVGGPILLPKIYNGKNKSFFFFNFEGYVSHNSSPGLTTLPTAAMRNGDFSAVVAAKIGTDAGGNPIYRNEIFDPLNTQTVNGHTFGVQFPNNTIPLSRMDPVALAVQKLIPLPTDPTSLINNFAYNQPNPYSQYVPGFTLDQSLPHSGHASFYFSDLHTNLLASLNGLPLPLSAERISAIYAKTSRLNYDQSVTPRLIFHAGAGYIRYFNPDTSPDSVLHYDAVGLLGLKGGAVDGMPRLNLGQDATYGGATSLGPTNANHYINDKLTSNASLTYVRGAHSFKLGAEFHIDIWADANLQNSGGNFTFSPSQTANFDPTQVTSGGTAGFAYASFLLGRADSAFVSPVKDPDTRRNGWSLFLQDNWKVTHKLTLDVGIRWDLNQWIHEIDNRMSEMSPSTPDPAAGGLPGGLVFAGNGPNRCNCSFAPAYPYSIGPRLGAAYQINDKTVVRAGFGVAYGQLGQTSWFTNNTNLFQGVGYNTQSFASPSSPSGTPGAILSQGLLYSAAALHTATLNPGDGTIPGAVNTANSPFITDQNAARAPRIFQYSIGIQRALRRDLTIEANYVGNRGVWEQDQSETNINGLNPATLLARGLDVNNPTTITLLNSTLGSATAKAAGITAPYAGFPLTASVAQALRPYPMYGTITDLWSPNGKSWYDSFQGKMTKRASFGLSLTASFTWSKALSLAGVNNVYNRSTEKAIASYDQPLLLSIAANYEVPRIGTNKLINAAVKGWTVGAVLTYDSALPLGVPGQTGSPSTSTLFLSSTALRVPGVPLYNVDINCHCYDVTKQVVLNPAAWTNPAAGQFGGSPRYSDFRGQRRPGESMSFGRRFRLGEKRAFQFRAELFNVFNRAELANPSTGAFNTAPTVTGGLLTGGYGVINSKAGLAIGPRNGQLVGRFEW